jgi:hypothetical protein
MVVVEPERRSPDLHYEISLALHERVAKRLSAEPWLVEAADAKLGEWLACPTDAAPLLEQWRDLLKRPLPEIALVLTSRSEDAAWLRKASPFAGTIPPREREQIIRDVRRRLASAA